jgi:hypothetical protein
LADPTTTAIPEKCPKCEHSPLFTMPGSPVDDWVCLNCDEYRDDHEIVGSDELREQVKRSNLRRDLMAVQIEIDHISSIVDDPARGPERADYRELLRLHLWLKSYLEDRRDLPFLEEHVRQLKMCDPMSIAPDLPDIRKLPPFLAPQGQSFLPVSVRLQQEELKLGCVEGGIRAFHRNLPWWHETYRITKKRIDRPAAQNAPKAVRPPALQSDEATPEPSEEQNDSREEQSASIPELRAIDDALEALTDKAGNRGICEWIDLHRGWVPCQYAIQRSNRKWTTYYDNAGRDARKPLEEKIRRRRKAYRDRKQTIL